MARSAHIDIVFDGPPGPEPGRFVEVEDHRGRSIRLGRWLKRTDGYWVLRFNPGDFVGTGPSKRTQAQRDAINERARNASVLAKRRRRKAIRARTRERS